MQDVIGRDADDGAWQRALASWRRRSPGRRRAAVVAGVAVVAAAVAAALLVAAEPGAGRGSAPPEVGLVVLGGTAAADRATATGALRVRLVGAGEAVPAADVTLAGRGLQLVSVESSPAGSAAGVGAGDYLLRYRVPDCAQLRLPAELAVHLADGGRSARPVGRLPADGDADGFRPCPVGAVPAPALAVRPRGGTVETTAAGARGAARLEVRNGGPALRLVAVTAQVPGVRFSSALPPRSVVLRADERIEVTLRFDVDDCSRVVRTGRLVLRAAVDGVERELGLTLGHDLEARRLRQVALDTVFDACSR